jgi:hypothetical protein
MKIFYRILLLVTAHISFLSAAKNADWSAEIR